jgi:peptidoglycan/LPS O-acetylase OafA/YrhL
MCAESSPSHANCLYYTARAYDTVFKIAMEFTSASRIPSLDGVRAMSVLLVIGGHLWGGSGGPGFSAALAVHVFFVLSGYLITRLLQQEHQRSGRIDLVAFYRRRCFRIFPAAFAYMLVIALFVPASRSALLYAATYSVSYRLSGTPIVFWHLWSLSVEEQFYLLWPLALLLGFQCRAWVAWITMIAAAAFRLTIALHAGPQAFGYEQYLYVHYSFPATMDSIAAGCLLAIYEPRVRERCRFMAESPVLVMAVPLTAWIVAGTIWSDKSTVLSLSLTVFWGAVPLLIALWIFLLIERQDRILNNPVAYTIGALSYSLYLWQQPFTENHELSTLQAGLMLSGCAVASYLFIEKPMLKLGASLKSRKPLPVPLPGELPVAARD